VAALGLLAVAIALFGAHRARAHGEGREKWLALAPVVLVAGGCLAAPFVIGFMMGARMIEAHRGSDLMMTTLRASLVLAAGIGALLAVMFTPRK